MQVASSRAFSRSAVRPSRASQPARTVSVSVTASDERYRLHNLSPQEGSRRDNKRKGRGYGGHQGGTCGFGTRGQKSRSGPGVRPGFEGGQTPLYRRLPKLRGIAGGMGAGLPKYVVVNLDDLEKAFEAGATVNLDTIKEKNLLNISGRDARLPLKVLGSGEVSKALTIQAASFSGSAKEKLAAAGATVEEVAQKPKWTRRRHERMVKDMAEKGLNYKEEYAKKKKAQAEAKKKAAV